MAFCEQRETLLACFALYFLWGKQDNSEVIVILTLIFFVTDFVADF